LQNDNFQAVPKISKKQIAWISRLLRKLLACLGFLSIFNNLQAGHKTENDTVHAPDAVGTVQHTQLLEAKSRFRDHSPFTQTMTVPLFFAPLLQLAVALCTSAYLS